MAPDPPPPLGCKANHQLHFISIADGSAWPYSEHARAGLGAGLVHALAHGAARHGTAWRCTAPLLSIWYKPMVQQHNTLTTSKQPRACEARHKRRELAGVEPAAAVGKVHVGQCIVQ